MFVNGSVTAEAKLALPLNGSMFPHMLNTENTIMSDATIKSVRTLLKRESSIRTTKGQISWILLSRWASCLTTQYFHIIKIGGTINRYLKDGAIRFSNSVQTTKRTRLNPRNIVAAAV